MIPKNEQNANIRDNSKTNFVKLKIPKKYVTIDITDFQEVLFQ